MVSVAKQLDLTFGALADPTRRAILHRLARGEASVQDLAAPFDMSLPAVSKHLRVLENAGLIERSADGKRRPSRLRAVPMRGAAQWIEGYRSFWEQSFDRLDALLEKQQRHERKDSKHVRKKP
ncbi:MAG TPA: metalloregulator ArsR/SmtB family transcription factor [Polyangiaceae bacterium]|nr:metalloregulator ArsR/SmtB family transcription factor [Polyangiaceae bacterium]